MSRNVYKIDALAPKPFCVLSILCSCVILREVYHPQAQANKRERTMQECLKNMALADVLFSFAVFLTTWPVPADIPIFFQNFGTEATCKAQAIVMEIGLLAAPLHGLNLSVLFLLVVRFNATESTLFSYHFWTQKVIWLFAITWSLCFILILQYYSPSPTGCALLAPMECYDNIEGSDAFCKDWPTEVESVFLYYIPVAGQVLLFGWIFWTVRRMESRVHRLTIHRHQSFRTTNQCSTNSTTGSTSSMQTQSQSTPNATPPTPAEPPSMNRARSQAIATRGLLFIAGYMICFSLNFAYLLYIRRGGDPNLGTFITSVCLYVTQGFWTLLVFMRNRKMLSREGIFAKKVLRCLLFEVDQTARNRPSASEENRNMTSPVVTISTGGSALPASTELGNHSQGDETRRQEDNKECNKDDMEQQEQQVA